MPGALPKAEVPIVSTSLRGRRTVSRMSFYDPSIMVERELREILGQEDYFA